MDAELFRIFAKSCPPLNWDVAEGYACKEVELAESYIKRVWLNAASSFPPGLVFKDICRCTPEEEYMVGAGNRNGKKTYEMAKSDIYLVKLLFEFNGVQLKPRYLYLPFVKRGGIITIMGSTYSISPVLADNAISVGLNDIFVNFNRAKVTFYRLIHRFIADDVRTSSFVVWCEAHNYQRSTVLNKEPKLAKTVKGQTSCIHYLFCRYGVTRTFAEFANADVRVVHGNTPAEDYPSSEWVVCRSTGQRPRSYVGRHYTPTDIVLVINRAAYNQTTASMIAAFFYICDTFSGRVEPEYVDDVVLWRVLLGHFIFANNNSEGTILNDVDAHMRSLDSYIDPMTRGWIANEVQIEDIFELFMHLVETFPKRLATSGDAISTMYGKRLMVLRYLLLGIIKAIFRSLYAINNAAKNGLTINDIEKNLQKFIKPHLIIAINRSNAVVTNISSPTDNMLFKITSNVVLQASTTGSAAGRAKNETFDESHVLHASIAEVGSYMHITKSETTGRGRLNMFVQLTPEGYIQRKESLRPIIDRVQQNIRR